MSGMTDRDHFAAAALTGLLDKTDAGEDLAAWWPEMACHAAYRWADAMLRERERTNLDAAPAAIAGTPGTGDTPATHATRGDGSERREGTQEPVAWGVVYPNDEVAVIAFKRQDAEERATASDRIVPLYRHPPCQDSSQNNLTLTDCERGAIERAVDSIASTMPYESQQGAADWKTLRGLLRRLK